MKSLRSHGFAQKSQPLLFIFSGLLILFADLAQAQHKGMNFQAVVKKTDGTKPTASGVTVTVQFLDPVTNCVLREEEHSGKNISNGYLNLVLGDSSAATPLTRNPSPLLSIAEVMDNKKSRMGLKCVDISNQIIATNQSYTPSGLDRRVVRLRFNVEGDEIVADFNMRSVGFAVNSEMLNSKTEQDFVNINSSKGVTQSNVESIFERFTKLDAILNGFNAAGTAAGINITGNAATATTATNVTGTVAIANGGTGATTAVVARTNLGLGTLATMSPTGTADNTTFLRGDGTWQVVSGGGGGVNFTGSLAGDVSGTQGATSVDKIKGRALDNTAPVDGQVLLWDNANSVWKAQYVRMQDVRNAWGGTEMIPASACAANQAMVWSVITDRFICQNIGNLDAALIASGTIAPARLGSGTADNTTYLRGDGTWQTISASDSTKLPLAGGTMTGALNLPTDGLSVGTNQLVVSSGSLGVGISSPNVSSILDITSTTKGLLIPRMTSTQRDAIVTPAAGLQIYNTTVNALNVFNGSSWQVLGAGGSGVASVNSANSDISIADTTTAPVLTLNTGTTGGGSDANKIVKLDASGLISVAMLPGHDTSKLITGILPISRGGTNSGAILSNNRMMISSGNAIVESAAINPGRAIASDGSGIPIASSVTATELGYLAGVTSPIQTQMGNKVNSSGWANFSLIGTDGSGVITSITGSVGGSILQHSATGPVYSTTSYPGTIIANQLLYSSANNVVGGLASSNNAILTTDSSGVPSWTPKSSDFFAQYLLANGRVGGQTLIGGTAASDNLTLHSTSNATKGNILLNPTNGNVGIGTTSPTAKLQVEGAMVSTTNPIATGASVNLAVSNTHTLSSVGGSSISLSNLVDGGTYTLVIMDTTARTYTFSGCTNSFFRPANAVTTTGTRTIYGILTIKNGSAWDCYINWTSGYQ